MSWEERIKQAAYTSPSGIRFDLLYEDVSRESDKKTTVFTFPDKDGAFIQDLGRGGRRYPLRIFFSGENYDLLANEFFAALEEVGVGVLDHPIYGTINVVPTGTIRQRDNLKTASNQAVFDIEFWETITEISFPFAETEAITVVNESIENFTVEASDQFDDELDLETSSETIDFKTKFLTALDFTKSVLDDIAKAQQEIKSQFDALYNTIQTNIDELIGVPVQLALNTIDFIRLPARALTGITAKLDAYGNLINGIIGNDFEPSFDNKTKNNFVSSSLFSTSYLIAEVEVTLFTKLVTKPDAISVADVIVQNFDNIINWSDTNRNTLNIIDTGEAYEQLQNAVAADTSRLVQISFSLKQERIITLDRNRTIIDLSAELYGTIDSQLDFLISSNNLNGDEIIELPKGKEIKYYI